MKVLSKCQLAISWFGDYMKNTVLCQWHDSSTFHGNPTSCPRYKEIKNINKSFNKLTYNNTVTITEGLNPTNKMQTLGQNFKFYTILFKEI